MSYDNENKRELKVLSYHLNDLLSKKYIGKRNEMILDLLAIPKLKDTLDNLSKNLGIKKLAAVPPKDFIDYYIVDCILESSAYGRTGSSEDVTLFLATYDRFNKQLTSLLEDFKLQTKSKDLIKAYLVADRAGDSSSEEQFVTVHIDDKTKALTLELSPMIKQTELSSFLPAIFKVWDKSRVKPANISVSGSAKNDSELARLKKDTSLAQVVRVHKKDGNYELWKKRIQRQENRQKKMLGDTKT